jgi:hypothetical protein
VAPVVGSGGVCVYGCLEPGSRFYVGAFVGKLTLVAAKMFSHVIYIIKKLCKYFAFSATYKNNAGINCITVYHGS